MCTNVDAVCTTTYANRRFSHHKVGVNDVSVLSVSRALGMPRDAEMFARRSLEMSDGIASTRPATSPPERFG